MLEHHADILAHLVQVGLFIGQVVAVHDDRAAGDLLQPVKAAQEGGLAAARGAQHDNDLALINISRYIAQNLQIAEVLLQMLNMNFYIVLIDGHG